MWDHGNHLNFGPLVSPCRRMVPSHSPDGTAGLSLTHCLDNPTLFALHMRSVICVAGTALPRRSFVASHRKHRHLDYHLSHLYLLPSLELLLLYDLILRDYQHIGVGNCVRLTSFAKESCIIKQFSPVKTGHSTGQSVLGLRIQNIRKI